MKRIGSIWIATMACVLWTVSTAAAQEQSSTSLEMLRSKLKTGERIELTNNLGKKITGKLDSLSGSLLMIRDGRTTLEIKESEIVKIRHRKPEKWWDGMLIGMAGGAAIGIVGTTTSCPNDSECAFIVGSILMPTFTGAGAGIGALVDSLFHKNETVFERNSRSALSRLNVAPDVGKDKKAVRVSFRF